ncbi:MAG: FAD-binding oxidoreductase, partial [Sporichthyaceae bacterium]|nr:FAD-binding oxidoreductase [Sporichthyaceae bacterium]
MPADAVLDDLTKVATTRAATDADPVSGVPARWVASPASTDEVSEVLRLASQHDLTVVARGAGTKIGWGAPPRSVDLVLDTTGLRGVVEHAAGDLIAVVRAGTPVDELQQTVASAGQQLALDAVLPHATVGGTLATGASGPRRLVYGTARDLLIGVTFVRGDGVVAHAGGKVVKNVAGYDFGKLLIGSYGTLGVITEAVFRLHPLPQARRFAHVRLPDAAAAGRVALTVLGSQLVPSAVELDQQPDGTVTVTVLIEGVPAGVPDRTAAALALLGDGAVESDQPPEGFGDYPFTSEGIGLKVTSSLRGVGQLLSAGWQAAAAHSVDLRVRGSAAGVLYAGLPAGTEPPVVAELLAALRASVTAYDGTITVLTAPADVRAAVDACGP